MKQKLQYFSDYTMQPKYAKALVSGEWNELSISERVNLNEFIAEKTTPDIDYKWQYENNPNQRPSKCEVTNNTPFLDKPLLGEYFGETCDVLLFLAE